MERHRCGERLAHGPRRGFRNHGGITKAENDHHRVGHDFGLAPVGGQYPPMMPTAMRLPMVLLPSAIGRPKRKGGPRRPSDAKVLIDEPVIVDRCRFEAVELALHELIECRWRSAQQPREHIGVADEVVAAVAPADGPGCFGPVGKLT
jgi:hypothetical protein